MGRRDWLSWVEGGTSESWRGTRKWRRTRNSACMITVSKCVNNTKMIRITHKCDGGVAVEVGLGEGEVRVEDVLENKIAQLLLGVEKGYELGRR